MARLAPLRWQIVVAVFLALTGLVSVAHLRSREALRQASGLPTWRLQELAVLVRQQETVRQRLETELDALHRREREYEAALAEGRGLTEAMARDTTRFRLVLGLVPVQGPGVRVVLIEGASTQAGILPPDVQPQDLSGLANELWSAGAEAMAINGVRVLATTPIRHAGGRVVVSGTPLVPPYRIEAIGEAAAMRAALSTRGGFVEGLRAVGLQVDVQSVERLHLPARSDPGGFRHARPRGAP